MRWTFRRWQDDIERRGEFLWPPRVAPPTPIALQDAH